MKRHTPSLAALLAVLVLLVAAFAPRPAAAQLPSIMTTRAAPPVQAASYAAGTVMGGLLALGGAARTNGPGSGLVQSMMVSFASGIAPSLDIVLFSSAPSSSTITDRTTLAVVAADLPKIVGVVHLTDWTLLGTSSPSEGQALSLALPFTLGAGNTTLYAAIVQRSASAVSPGSASDMTIALRFIPD